MTKKHFLEKTENIKKMLAVFFVVCALLFLADFIFVSGIVDKHAYYGWENWPGFYPAFGLIAYVSLVFVSEFIVRKLVKRKEDYYD